MTRAASAFFWSMPELFASASVHLGMKLTLILGISVLSMGLGCALALAQEYAKPLLPDRSQPQAASDPVADPVPLDWVPPAMGDLRAQAALKSDFVFDKAMLGMAAEMVPDSDVPTRQAINKLDGVSVHLLRFGAAGLADEREVDAIRASYHLRGWKHIVTATNTGGPIHNQYTDVWFVLDGINVRGAVVLAETPKSLTLVTVAGNLSPVDLMHLRGHFGIPRLDANDFKSPAAR
jgi:hypothetical protein